MHGLKERYEVKRKTIRLDEKVWAFGEIIFWLGGNQIW